MGSDRETHSGEGGRPGQDPNASDRLARLVDRAMAHPWSPDQVRSALVDPRAEVRVEWATPGASGGAAIGCVLARWTASDLLEIDLVAVDPAHRRHGLARRLLGELLQGAQQRGMREARLELASDNAGAWALYRGLGFVVVGRRARYYPDGADALLLSLRAPEGDRAVPRSPGRTE